MRVARLEGTEQANRRAVEKAGRAHEIQIMLRGCHDDNEIRVTVLERR
jgi:hypothetical protein